MWGGVGGEEGGEVLPVALLGEEKVSPSGGGDGEAIWMGGECIIRQRDEPS